MEYEKTKTLKNNNKKNNKNAKTTAKQKQN